MLQQIDEKGCLIELQKLKDEMLNIFFENAWPYCSSGISAQACGKYAVRLLSYNFLPYALFKIHVPALGSGYTKAAFIFSFITLTYETFKIHL